MKTSLRTLRGLVALLAFTPPLLAQNSGPLDAFHHAYYLETAQGDYEGAAKLYEEVIAGKRVSDDLRAEAKERLAGCKEELATSDLARLMPSTSLAYAEINRPGEQVRRLLGQLGLLRAAGDASKHAAEKIAISPALIDAMLGLRGAAAAVTGFDSEHERPTGVFILHPGNVAAIRGLIETALPVGGKPTAPIAGFPTYQIEDEAFVTLTARLVIASATRSEIEDVIDRLTDGGESLASNPDIADVMKGRRDDLLFFCVNVKPILPLIDMGLRAAGAERRELAVAQALLDIRTLRSISGRLGVGESDVHLNVALELSEGHHSLAYNLLRLAPVDPETLKRIPAGAAGFVALALNKPDARVTPSSDEEARVISALDIPREVFGNLCGLTAFVLPPERDSRDRQRGEIPDAGLIMSVRDPAKSSALWTQMLGVAAVATGQGAMEGVAGEIEGTRVRTFQFEGGIAIHLATLGNQLVVSPSRSVLARVIGAGPKQGSLAGDTQFSRVFADMTPDTTLALGVHAGRCLAVARPYMKGHDLKEIEPIAAMLADTVAAVSLEQGPAAIRLRATVSGLPNVSPMLTQLIREKRGDDRQEDDRFWSSVRRNTWEEGLPKVEQRLAEHPDDVEALKLKFDLLAVGKGDNEEARAAADLLFQAIAENATELNNFAWELLTQDHYGDAYVDLAHRFALRSNELTKQKNWAFLDTLALAEFKRGKVDRAVDLQKKALELCTRADSRDELRKRLSEYEDAAESHAPSRERAKR
ncbi:MAG: tetratricopeptide repeat protein [Phycisphaerae bacterium]